MLAPSLVATQMPYMTRSVPFFMNMNIHSKTKHPFQGDLYLFWVWNN